MQKNSLHINSSVSFVTEYEHHSGWQNGLEKETLHRMTCQNRHVTAFINQMFVCVCGFTCVCVDTRKTETSIAKFKVAKHYDNGAAALLGVMCDNHLSFEIIG